MDGDGRKRRPAGAGCERPPQASTSISKPWMKWSDSLQSLLSDTTGSELFEKYLQQEGVSSQLDFIYAVDGLKSTANDDDDVTLSQKIRSILRLSQILIGLSASTRENLNAFYTESTKHLNADVTIFDNAIEEVESHMRANLYPNFLKSDIYISYVATYTSTTTSSTALALQTVQEDTELNVKRQGLTRKALKNRNWWKDEHQLKNESISSLGSSGTANPYHAGYSPYVPVSRQDSEIQSLSSGANTEHRFPVETRGFHSFHEKPSSSSSSRGRQAGSSSKHKHQHHLDNLQEIAQSSHRRTDISYFNRGESAEACPDKYAMRPPSVGSKHKQQQIDNLQEVVQSRAIPHENKGEIAEKRPDKFASDLIEKLQLVANSDARGIDRFPNRFSDATPHVEGTAISTLVHGGPPQKQQQPHPQVIAEALRRIKEQPSEHADDILEEHFSRVFPDKTPDGRPSPPNQSSKSPPPFGKPKQSRKQGHHVKKSEDLEPGMFTSHHSRTPGYEEVVGGSGNPGVPSSRHIRRQQRSDIIDSGISVLSSSVAAVSLSRGSSSALGPGVSATQMPNDPFWRPGRGGNGNGNGSSGAKLMQAIIFYEDDPKGVPYGLKLPASKVTLGILKDHLPRRGPFRYFFKRHSSSVEGSIIQEEITRDDQTLPLFEGKLVATLKCT